MTNKKSTKRSLLLSALSLVLCLSMLVGTTFAWFTDSVTSDKNRITAGNLDVELDYYTGTEWKSVQGATDLFSDELWEPGHTEVVYLKITNAGSLALKYQLGVKVAEETGSINVKNEEFKLSDYILFGVDKDKTPSYTDRAAAIEAVANSSLELNKGYSQVGTLAAGKEAYLALVVYMPTSVGNEANYKKGAPVPTIDLGIDLIATQLAAENDSYGNTYDDKASVTVKPGEDLAAAIRNVEDGGIVFLENGVYDLTSGPIVIEGKKLSIVGLGNVTLNKNYGSTHIFTLRNGAEVIFKNLTMNGQGNTREGVYVRWNCKVVLEDVVIKNTGGSDIMIDEASDAATHGKETASYVTLINTDIEDVAMCASPVTSVAATQNTYVYFNYDKASTVGAIDVQSINNKPENIIINGVASTEVGKTMQLYASNDAELAAALNTIQTNSNYWNKQVVVYLAAGEYSGNYVINQFPQWNGTIGAGGSGNNYAGGVPAGDANTNITFVGETVSTYSARAKAVPGVIFTGSVKVNGFGNSNTGLDSATSVTVFQNVAFDGAASAVAGEDNSVVSILAAASNVSFEGCTFANATHVTLGARNPDIIGNVAFTGCEFNNGGCLSGYYKNLTVTNCNVYAADNGFLNLQNAGKITVTGGSYEVGRYFIRTNGSGVELTVDDAEITVYESQGTKHLVFFRGASESVKFTDCDITAGYTTAGVDADSTLKVTNYVDMDGATYALDGVTGEQKLYLVPADYTDKTFVVAEGTDSIGNYAFAYNSNVKTVVLASTVRDLGRGFDSSSVEKVVLNEGLTTISSRAFKSTTALKEVVISSTVTEIADNAFQKSGIKEIVIPANVKTIGEAAFGSSLIEKVTFKGDIAIQGYAFRGCPNLRTVEMNGDDVTFVASTLNGRNSCWFCNGESNNPNTSNITFYVKNDEIKNRVLTAMGAEKNNTPVVVEQTTAEGGYFVDENGNATAYEAPALDAALNDGKNVVLAGNLKFSSSDTTANSGYGATGVSVKGGILDGNGHSLGINNWGTWDAAVHTTGGTIKNLKVNSGMRGIFMGSATADVYIDNVIIDGTIYTFNSDGGNKNYGVYISNSTLNGWTSHSDVHKEVVYTNCSFGEGQGYAFCRPYGPTKFVGCNFSEGYEVDARGAVTFENCTIGGVALTAGNLATLVTSNIANATVIG